MTTFILYQVTSRLLSLVKSIYVSTKVSNIPFLIFVQAPLFSFRRHYDSSQADQHTDTFASIRTNVHPVAPP